MSEKGRRGDKEKIFGEIDVEENGNVSSEEGGGAEIVVREGGGKGVDLSADVNVTETKQSHKKLRILTTDTIRV